MDRFRLIKFSSGGRPVVIADLNTGSALTLVRDTLKLVPAAAQTVFARSGVRHGGAWPVAQSHDNGTCEFELYINAATATEALSLFDSVAGNLDETREQRYLEWRPDGGTTSLFYALRGPAQAENLYRWIEFQSTKTLHGKFVCAVAPLAEGDRFSIRDDFAVDSIADYTFDTGGGTLSVSGGQLVPSSTAQKVIRHTARGYSYGDAQVTWKFTTGASVAATWETRAIVKAIPGVDSYVFAGVGNNNFLEIYVRTAGSNSFKTSAATSAFTTSTTYWLRVRVDGNVVTAELFTSAPTPMATPATTVSHTLAGADATNFGSSVVGQTGGILTPKGTDWRYDDFVVEPYTYRNQTLPAVISLGGKIPGNAPALVDVSISHTGSVIPFALIGWASRATAGTEPFGIFEAESDMVGDRVGWSITADGTASGSSKLYDSSVSGVETYGAAWAVDPALMAPDTFSGGELQIEVWGRLQYSTLTSTKIVISARSALGTGFGYDRYTAEWGSTGKPLVPATGTSWRFCRLGVLTMFVDPARPIAWKVVFSATTGVGSTGVFGLDYLILVPARQRAASPTGKANNTSYPRFINSTSLVTRRIRSNLSGMSAGSNENAQFPDHGLGGNQIIMPPGSVDCVVKLSSLVPDDPTSDATSESLTETATVQFDVIPRYYLARGE